MRVAEVRCRTSLRARYDFYFDKPTNQLLPEQANFGRKGLKRTCKVGSYQPNRLGLYDMHGNVWEWCDDVQKAADGTSLRVARGGGWLNVPGHCRAADRAVGPPVHRREWPSACAWLEFRSARAKRLSGFRLRIAHGGCGARPPPLSGRSQTSRQRPPSFPAGRSLSEANGGSRTTN